MKLRVITPFLFAALCVAQQPTPNDPVFINGVQQPQQMPLKGVHNPTQAELAALSKEMCGKFDPATQLDSCEVQRLRNEGDLAKMLQDQITRLNLEFAKAKVRQMAEVNRVLAAHPGMKYEQPSTKFPAGRLLK